MIDLVKQQRTAFIQWLRSRTKANGERYSENTITSYTSALSNAPKKLTGIEVETRNVFEITSTTTFKKVRAIMEGADNFKEVNDQAGNRAFQYALQYYEELLVQQETGELSGEPSSFPQHLTAETEVRAMDKNILLYGPPGTGKTYNTVAYAVAMIENKTLAAIQLEIATDGYEQVLTRYRTYKEQGQIAFTTFHQSYGYEEFIEGIKPKLDQENQDQSTESISYEIKAGLFKAFCEKAEAPIVSESNEYGIRQDPTIWKLSLGGSGENAVKRDCFNHDRIRIGWDGYGEKITETTDFSPYGGANILTRFIDEMMIGDIVLVLYDEKTIDAIGVVTGEYKWLDSLPDHRRTRSVNWLIKDIRENIYALNGNKVMTLGSVYRLNRITLSDVLHMIQKHNPSPSSAIQENSNRYVFIIDEINRGNISKIFGELITLIEPTKRIGQAEELKVRLPYSQVEFGVPDNVYILGTMNTADRSIARLDTALRRRFHFAEMMPDPGLLQDIQVADLDLVAMLTKMNRRIEVLYDREHTIGHAYFLPLASDPSLENLAHIFKNAILPLLQEYFYEDYHKIRLVLGDLNKAYNEQFIHAKQIDVTDLFGSASEMDLDDEVSYAINENAFKNPEAFRKIYSV